MTFVIREYAKGDEHSIQDLYWDVLRQKRSIEQWKWEYRDSPEGPARIVVLCKGREVIGHYAIIPMKGRMRGAPCIIGKAEGAMVKREYSFIVARKGLFKELIRQAVEGAFGAGIPVLFGFTNSPRDFVAAGFSEVGTVHALQREMRFLGQVKSRMKSLLRRRRDYTKFPLRDRLVDVCRRGRLGRRISREQVRVDVVSDIPDDMDSVSRCEDGERLIRIEKDRAYLAWRFGQNPFVRPVMLVARKRGVLRGWMVVSVVRGALGRGYVVDFNVDASDPDIIQYALFREMLAYFTSQNVAYISCWRSDSPRDETAMVNFGLWGMRRCVGAIDFLVMFDRDEVDESLVTGMSNWTLSMAMTEGRWG